MPIMLRKVGQRIRFERKMQNLSQQELAEKVGYADKGLISRIESGSLNLSMDKLIKIADALHVDVTDLLIDPEPMEKKVEKDVMLYDVSDISTEGQERIKEYINMIRSAELWQKQNGTEKGGDSGSHVKERRGPSPLQRPDEKDAQK